MSNLPPAELAARLHAYVTGLPADEAAIDLLIGHGRWLHDTSFVEACVVIDGPFVAVDWDQALDMLADPPPVPFGDLQVLTLAIELAGYSTESPLGHCLIGLDDHTGRLVLDAFAHALGRGETRR